MPIPLTALRSRLRSAGTGLVTLALIAVSADTVAAQHNFRTRGSEDALAELTVYSDFECPYCRNFALVALPAINAEFVEPGKLRIRFVFFPLAATHRNAVAAAKAAYCAGQVDRFWAYHDYVFVRQPEWAGQPAPDSLWLSYAANLGLDRETFRACLGATETTTAIQTDLREAIASGATGTPTIVIGDHSIAGISSYAELRREILTAIEEAAGR